VTNNGGNWYRARAQRGVRRGVLAALAACVCVAGCSKERKSLAEIEEAYAGMDYSETVALCKYAIRRNWDTPRVYYYYGAALVSLDRDYEGYQKLDEAVAREMSIAAEAAELLRRLGLEAAGEGERPTAARRLKKASEYDPGVELGPYRFLVADAYFEDKNYGRAAPLYRAALDAYPDTSIAETASFNMAIAYDEMGWHTLAREAYEGVLDRFPRGEHHSDATWRLSNLLYEEAEKQHVLGNYEDAVTILDALVERTDNRGLLQKTHFLLGETYEAMGEFKQAHGEYREVISVDRGASGRIVERAREKIAALQEAGLY
jgi:tetratricopeptide (TPR) repeat protein